MKSSSILFVGSQATVIMRLNGASVIKLYFWTNTNCLKPALFGLGGFSFL
jgi:hypothetical protein